MPTYLYAILAGDKVKIGYSEDPHYRLSQLQTGNPVKLQLVHFEEVPTKKAKAIEKIVHLQNNYRKLVGEWFSMSKDDAISELIFARIRYEDDPLVGK